MSKLFALAICLGAGTAAAAPLPDDPPLPGQDPIPNPNPNPTTDPAPAPAPPSDPVPAPTTDSTLSTLAPAPMTIDDELDDSDSVYKYAWHDARMQSGIGVGLAIGGGVSGFTDKAMRDTLSSNVGGLWDARLSIGTHVPIGVDLSYVGTAGDVNTLAGTPNGTLIGTTAEAALRWNIIPRAQLTPYLFGGFGWQHYNVTNVKVAQSDSGMKSSDDIAEFPMGAGLSFRDPSGFTVDARGTFRAATDSTLLLDQSTNSFAKLHTWEASAALGYEF